MQRIVRIPDRGVIMEETKYDWQANLLQTLQRIEELEAKKKKEREKMISLVKEKRYEHFLISESEMKKIDAEVGILWTYVRANRDKWAIERAIDKEKSQLKSNRGLPYDDNRRSQPERWEEVEQPIP